MRYKYDRSFIFQVNDDNWEAYLITDEEATELDELINDDSTGFAALTSTGKHGRCLFIVEGNVTTNIINHELFHIYVSYFCIDSANISLVSFEEMIAEFLENHLEKFITKRDMLYNEFRKLEGSGR